MMNLLFYKSMFIPTIVIPMAVEDLTKSTKFWIVRDIYTALSESGVDTKLCNIIAFSIACIILVTLVWLLNIVVTQLSLLLIKKQDVKASVKIYNILIQHKFFNRLFVLAAIIVVLFSARMLFSGFSTDWVQFVVITSRSVMIVWVLLLLYSLLNSWDTFFILHPKTQEKSLRGYIQLIKIILAITATILIISTVIQKDPSNLFVGFGATAAFMTLVFRDTILGFVASMQLSFQDMIRLGDWIEMPSKNADGLIVDINLSSVKVQNWDNSVTMIPIYTMVTDSFTNWRRMEIGPGRLFVRSFQVNIESIKFADEALLQTLSKHAITGSYFNEVLSLANVSSPAESLNNLALFRAYLEVFLRKHPEINDEMMLFVRYLHEISERGIGLEVYAFSRKTTLATYDVIHRSVMEHIISTASIFDIRLYQSPSGDDFRHMKFDTIKY